MSDQKGPKVGSGVAPEGLQTSAPLSEPTSERTSEPSEPTSGRVSALDGELDAAALKRLVLEALAGEAMEHGVLSAKVPEPVAALRPAEVRARVRQNGESVLLAGDGPDAPTRGFVRAVLRVPLGHPQAAVYGVFVELERSAYGALKAAARAGEQADVPGTLATKLPLLGAAYGAPVTLRERGAGKRPLVIASPHPLLVHGPDVGAR